MTAAERVIATLRAEVGYVEKRSNAQLDDKTANAGSANYTKYARDLDGTDIFNTPKQGYDWCAVFTVWPYWKLWGAEVARRMLYLPKRSCAAGVDWMARYFKEAGAFVSAPVVGGPIFFKNAAGQWQHVETVVDVKGGTVYTIGGNTSGGVRVAAKQYSVKDSSVGGYGRPNWAAAPADAGPEEEEDMTGEQIYKALTEYLLSQEPPAWVAEQGEYAEAVREGITDGSDPTRLTTRYESAIMTLRAMKKARGE